MSLLQALTGSGCLWEVWAGPGEVSVLQVGWGSVFLVIPVCGSLDAHSSGCLGSSKASSSEFQGIQRAKLPKPVPSIKEQGIFIWRPNRYLWSAHSVLV